MKKQRLQELAGISEASGGGAKQDLAAFLVDALSKSNRIDDFIEGLHYFSDTHTEEPAPSNNTTTLQDIILDVLKDVWIDDDGIVF